MTMSRVRRGDAELAKGPRYSSPLVGIHMSMVASKSTDRKMRFFTWPCMRKDRRRRKSYVCWLSKSVTRPVERTWKYSRLEGQNKTITWWTKKWLFSR